MTLPRIACGTASAHLRSPHAALPPDLPPDFPASLSICLLASLPSIRLACLCLPVCRLLACAALPTRPGDTLTTRLPLLHSIPLILARALIWPAWAVRRQAVHGFDFWGISAILGLTFYQRVTLVNHLRVQQRAARCFICGDSCSDG